MEKQATVSSVFELSYDMIDLFLVLVNQKLFFYLGHQGQTMPRSRTNMASISKVTRNSNEAPSNLTINEWFNYASSTISAVGTYEALVKEVFLNTFLPGLRDFPSMDDVPNAVLLTKTRSKQYEQSAESIFILPGLELRFQTRQLSGKRFHSVSPIKTKLILFFRTSSL